jgi:hypothetical protein
LLDKEFQKAVANIRRIALRELKRAGGDIQKILPHAQIIQTPMGEIQFLPHALYHQ